MEHQQLDLDLNTDLAEAVRSSCMLVSLSISVWSGKKDDKFAREVLSSAIGVDPRNYKVPANLLGKHDGPLEELRRMATDARETFKRHTLPYATHDFSTGQRMLPNTKWTSFMKSIGGIKSDFEAKAAEFCQDYPDLKARALSDWGTHPNAALLFPTDEDIQWKFSFKLDFAPVPEGGHFRGLPVETADALRDAFEQRFEERLDHAKQYCKGELQGIADKAVRQTSTPDDPEAKRPPVYASTFEQLADEAARIRSFQSFSGAFRTALMHVDRVVAHADVDLIRKDEAERARIHELCVELADAVRSI